MGRRERQYALITSGAVVLVVSIPEGLRQEDLTDERTKKIGAWGLSYSWFFTFLVLFILFWIESLGLIILESETIVLFLVLFMVLSAKGLQRYFFQKGDVV